MTKVAIISDSPTLHTGFGIVSRQIVEGLAERGNAVVCFGLGQIGETFDRSALPCSLWTTGRNFEQAIPLLQLFFENERPDILLIHSDIASAYSWFDVSRALGWSKPVVIYFVVDGLPLSDNGKRFIENVEFKITPTQTVARYLEQRGVGGTVVLPHGVDTTLFRPITNRAEWRHRMNWQDKFVIGVFGRNGERKQQPRVLLAVSQLIAAGAKNVHLHLHCAPIDDPSLGGWNLPEVSKQLNICDHVTFTHGNLSRHTPRIERTSTEDKEILRSAPYPVLMACCDLIVNAAFCGGFELTNLEAQATGVPLVMINDHGNMSEVVGTGAYQMTPDDEGIWRTGARQYNVFPATIVSAINHIRADQFLREQLIVKGFENVARFSWTTLRTGMADLISSIVN
jgi:glycosyltransferase involved in cell wall biosynthesis